MVIGNSKTSTDPSLIGLLPVGAVSYTTALEIHAFIPLLGIRTRRDCDS